MYTMCIDRSSHYGQLRFTVKVEKSSWYYQRNGVYKMCNDRSSHYSQWRFTLKLEEIYFYFQSSEERWLQNVFSSKSETLFTYSIPSLFCDNGDLSCRGGGGLHDFSIDVGLPPGLQNGTLF